MVRSPLRRVAVVLVALRARKLRGETIPYAPAIAAGAALSAQYRGTQQIAIAFFSAFSSSPARSDV